MITRENYEIYFMEYMDGNLSAREQAEVEAFLLVYTDLRELLDGIFTGDKIFVSTPKKLITQLLKKCVGIITGFWNSIYGKKTKSTEK